MSRSRTPISVPAAITVGAVAVIALIASGVLRPSPVTGGTPSSPPVASPSAPALLDPTPVPTPKLVDDFSDGQKDVRLDIATPHYVVAEIKDFTGSVVDATSGRAADGMSVRWYELDVVNLDEDTLRLTWVGSPSDDPVKVVVTDLQGEPTIVVMQLMPPEDSDAIGFDRVLDLDFHGPVVAEDFATLVQDGWDTAG
jgi:hypothetical protein